MLHGDEAVRTDSGRATAHTHPEEASVWLVNNTYCSSGANIPHGQTRDRTCVGAFLNITGTQEEDDIFFRRSQTRIFRIKWCLYSFVLPARRHNHLLTLAPRKLSSEIY